MTLTPHYYFILPMNSFLDGFEIFGEDWSSGFIEWSPIPSWSIPSEGMLTVKESIFFTPVN